MSTANGAFVQLQPVICEVCKQHGQNHKLIVYNPATKLWKLAKNKRIVEFSTQAPFTVTCEDCETPTQVWLDNGKVT